MCFVKTLRSAAAAYIMGFSPAVKARGSKVEINAFSKVLESSRDVYNLLQGKPTADMLSEALSVKSENAKHFQQVTGQSWPF